MPRQARSARLNESEDSHKLLSEWPVEMPHDWPALVNQEQTAAQSEALQEAIKRSRPYGSKIWVEQTVKKLHLQWTIRYRGSPRVRPIKDSRP